MPERLPQLLRASGFFAPDLSASKSRKSREPLRSRLQMLPLPEKLLGESSRGNTNRGNTSESLWEGNLPLRGSLRGPLRTSEKSLKTSEKTLKRDPLRGRFPSQRLSAPIVLPLKLSPNHAAFWDPKMRDFLAINQRTPWGGVEKRGGRKTSRMTPHPKKGSKNFRESAFSGTISSPHTFCTPIARPK